MALLSFVDKDEDEILDYTIDFSQWVAAGRTIQAAGTSVVVDGASTPNGDTSLLVDQVVVGSNLVVAWISGGLINETYKLKYVAVDDNNPVRTVVRRAKLKIKEK